MKTQDRRRPRPFRCLIALAVMGTATAGQSFGQEMEMRRRAKLIRIESVADGRAAELLPDSLLNFNDPAGKTQSGSLWAWGASGRPRAIVELSKEGAGPDAVRWVEGVTSFSADPITAKWDDGHRWESSAPGLTMNPVDGAEAPADSEPGRLRQMRTIARKFALLEDAGSSKRKVQLRLLPNPIHRYSDAASGLRDGAIFVFAYGTNPEAFLAVEARSADDSAPGWQYGLARVTGGALSAKLDGREVWKLDEADPPHSGPSYMNRLHPPIPSK